MVEESDKLLHKIISELRDEISDLNSQTHTLGIAVSQIDMCIDHGTRALCSSIDNLTDAIGRKS